MAKFFLAALVILLLAGGGFWYWTSTPQYSMLRLAEAVKNHDGPNFRRYFDIDSVSRHAVDDLMANSVQKIGGAGLLQRLVGITLGGLFKPELAQILGRNINDYVEKVPEKKAESNADAASIKVESGGASEGSEQSLTVTAPRGGIRKAIGGFFKQVVDAIRPPSMREVLQELGLKKENYRGLTPFETQGDICHVGLRFQPPGKEEIQVQLELENTKDHWRVTRFSNLDAIARSVSGI